ncbi:MAG: hypothetical protein ACHP8B_04130 [Terriglobales bacterium]
MGEELTPEQVEERYVALMGPELGTIYTRLWNECVWLFWKWDDYVVLFGTSAERLDKLNKAAPAFFYQLQGTLWEDVLLHISRLTDRPKTNGKKENLTLKRLPYLVHTSIRVDVERLISSADQKCEFAHDWRNRRIAHRDLALALKESAATPLRDASRSSVRDALDAIAAVLNRVGRHHADEDVPYHMFEPRLSARALVYVIEEGLKAEHQWREAHKAASSVQGGPAK